MSSIYNWEFTCVDESTLVYDWSTTVPTVCPNNNTHTIDVTHASVVESIVSNIYKTEENTTGDFETTHIKMDIPSGTPGDVTEHDVTWPMNILLWITDLTPTSDMIEDEITVMAAPETQVGAITGLVNIGDTVLNVDPGIFNYIKRGYLITLDDTTNKDVLGRLIAHDSVAGTITVDTPTSYSYAPGTPVKISIYIIKELYVADTNVIPIGRKGMKGKLVDAGRILRVYYTNNSGTAKIFRWRPEYYNDG